MTAQISSSQAKQIVAPLHLCSVLWGQLLDHWCNTISQQMSIDYTTKSIVTPTRIPQTASLPVMILDALSIHMSPHMKLVNYCCTLHHSKNYVIQWLIHHCCRGYQALIYLQPFVSATLQKLHKDASQLPDLQYVWPVSRDGTCHHMRGPLVEKCPWSCICGTRRRTSVLLIRSLFTNQIKTKCHAAI